MGQRKPTEPDVQPLLPDEAEISKEPERFRSLASRSLNSRGSGASRNRYSSLSRRSVIDLENKDSDVAFTIVVRKEGTEDAGNSQDFEEAAVIVTQEAVSDAVQDVSHQDKGHFFACGQAVQDAVQEAVQDAIQQAFEDNVRFDVRANFFTLIAITGVILFWRGIWSLWDKLFGFSIWSELGSIAAGLVVMITFRLVGVPLLDGLPSG